MTTASVCLGDRMADSVHDNKDVLLFSFLVNEAARHHCLADAEMDILSLCI